MNRSIRLLSVVALAASGLVVTSQPAFAAIDASCQFAGGQKLATLNLPADDHDEGAFTLGRIPGSKRIGFDSDEVDWGTVWFIDSREHQQGQGGRDSAK